MSYVIFLHIFIYLLQFSIAPPPYDPNYPPPQQGYPQQGYPSQGYPPQGYPPPQQGYYPPAPAAQQQQTSNVVVVQQQPTQQTTIIRERKPQVNHLLHFIITFFIFPPWLFVWIILCIVYGA